jgi:hypothetical protein
MEVGLGELPLPEGMGRPNRRSVASVSTEGFA